MLTCVMLMGSLFVSDGDVMISFQAMSHVERQGGLLQVGAGERQDMLDVSGYPEDFPVHMILSDCAQQARKAPGMDYASM